MENESNDVLVSFFAVTGCRGSALILTDRHDVAAYRLDLSKAGYMIRKREFMAPDRRIAAL
jgi:hypothetical protein